MGVMMIWIGTTCFLPPNFTCSLSIPTFYLSPATKVADKGSVMDKRMSTVHDAVEEGIRTTETTQRPTEDNKHKEDLCKWSRRGDVIHVVTSGDKRTFAAMVTLAASVILNTKSSVMFHFITFDSQAANLSLVLQSSIVRNATYEIIPFSKDKLQGQFVVRGPRPDLANPMNFVRFYLPDLLPCVNHLAYIDVDCLVLGDVKDMVATRIAEKHVIAALPEPKIASTVINFTNPYIVHNSTIQTSSIIMSAGVFVANMTRWRERNITSLLDYWMKLNVRSKVVRYSGNGAGSQAVMLLALHDKYSPLSKSWNMLYEYQQSSRGLTNAKLLHWNGPGKPWKNRRIKNSAVWYEYFHRSNATLLFRGGVFKL